jgi:hypothetical protein
MGFWILDLRFWIAKEQTQKPEKNYFFVKNEINQKNSVTAALSTRQVTIGK